MVSDKIGRRDFIKRTLAGGAGLCAVSFLGCGKKPREGVSAPAPAPTALPAPVATSPNKIAVAGGSGPAANTRRAVELLGGMQNFVRRGDMVVVKPNIGWNRTPDRGATTHPEVVRAVVTMCLDAGAKEVKVFDRPCDNAEMAYRTSGIREAAKQAGARVGYVKDRLFKQTAIPGEMLTSWPLYSEALDADVFINLPVAKTHNEAVLTLSVKNLMGIMGGERGAMHKDIHQKLADLYTRVKPHLNILDATTTMYRHGPQGLSVHDLEQSDTIIAGVNAVTVDAYAARTLPFRLKTEDPLEMVEYLQNASRMGLGEVQLAKMKVMKVSA